MKIRKVPHIMGYLGGCALALILDVNMALGAEDTRAKMTDANEVKAELGKTGLVHVIVEFALSDPTRAAPLSEENIEQRKTAIAAMQGRLISRHFPEISQTIKSGGLDRGLRKFTLSPMFAITLDGTELEKLVADPDVRRIYLDRLEKLQLQTSVPLIGMTGPRGAYAYGATGKGQVVAVIDSGIQSNHPFLTGKVIHQACFSNAFSDGVSLCANGQNSQTGPGAAEATIPPCYSGSENLCDHGTHVAGIALGANPDPGVPPNGVAREAELVAVQAFTRFNDATSCGGYASTPCLGAYRSDTLAALEWVYEIKDSLGGVRNLAAVNMSFGAGAYSTYCDNDPRAFILTLLRTAGVAPVAASGNDSYVNAIAAPACVASVVAVGATNMDDTRAPFTNESPLMVDLMAPGRAILSSVPVGKYQEMSGTSMASPHVAGAFAAIRSRLPTATVSQIEDALKTTGVSISSFAKTYTKPRIMIPAALEALGARLQLPLTITKTGSGSIVSSPAGIDCGQVCSHDFDTGIAVVLTATPDYAFRFDTWGDACVGNTSTCSVGMDTAKTATASFVELPKVNLVVTKPTLGVINSDPSGINCGLKNKACTSLFPQTRDVLLTALPNDGYMVKSWLGCATAAGDTCKVTINQSGNLVKATFAKLPKFVLKVTKTKYGAITSTPVGVKCGNSAKACSGKFYSGSVVTLDPVPMPGKVFQGWSGDCSGTGSCSLRIDGNKKASAVFQ